MLTPILEVKNLKEDWIIEDILPETAEISIIYGNHSTYKSFLILDMLLCIATGKDWHGKKTKKKNCVYITTDSETGTAIRFVAWQVANNIKVMENFILVSRAAIIDDPVEYTYIADLIAKLKPEIVVFDTLSRSMIGDETNTKDVRRVIKNLDKLIQDYGCKFIFIHNNFQETSATSFLLSTVDVVIEAVKCDKNKVVLKCKKMRDYKPFTDMKFRMKVTSTGYVTEEGDQINSLVPVSWR